MRRLLLLIGTLVLSACGANAPTATPTVAPTPTMEPTAEPAAAALNVGDDAPAFSLPDAHGGSVALSDYAGRPVLLYFHMAVG